MVMDENGLPPPVPRELYLQEYHGFLASSAGSDLSYENFMKFIRALVKYMASSKTVEILSSYFDKNVITSINLEDFSSLYPSEPDFLLGVLHNLNHADSILHLKFNPDKENDGTPPPKMEPTLWTQFTKMKNLNEIEIEHYYFTLLDLMEMSKHLPALRTLKVVIDSESRLPIECLFLTKTFKDAFQHLEAFIYSTTKLDERGKRVSAFRFLVKFTNFCVLHLPNLREVRCLNKMFDMNVACELMQQTSRMEHLQLNPNNLSSLAANAEKFPRVTSLSLNWKKVDNFFNCVNWVSLEKFTKLIHVQNYDLNPNHIATFCFKFGAILESLHFGYTTKNRFKINMLVIKDDCPKLKKLEIVGTGVDDRYSLESFASLLDLRITFQTNVRKEVKLSKLLAAPNLKIVKLSDFRVSRRELRETIELIENMEILTKVETLSLMLDGRMIDENAREAVAMEKEFKNFFYEVQYVREGEASVEIDFD